jgi:hypothetical protein
VETGDHSWKNLKMSKTKTNKKKKKSKRHTKWQEISVPRN